MSDKDRAFAGSIPAIYDRFLGPMIFEPYAADLAARLGDPAPAHILETAAGTGILTEAILKFAGAASTLVATDLNEAMLVQASDRIGRKRAIFRTADAQALPFGEAEFDLVACQFGAMFFPDKILAYREARRVLKPKARFLFNVWGRIADNPLMAIVHDSVAALFPADPPGFLARTPCGYNDETVIGGHLEAAGFTDIAIEKIIKRGRAESAEQVATGFCQGSPLRSEIEARDPDGLDRITGKAAEAVVRRYGMGPIEADMTALVISAVA